MAWGDHLLCRTGAAKARAGGPVAGTPSEIALESWVSSPFGKVCVASRRAHCWGAIFSRSHQAGQPLPNIVRLGSPPRLLSPMLPRRLGTLIAIPLRFGAARPLFRWIATRMTYSPRPQEIGFPQQTTELGAILVSVTPTLLATTRWAYRAQRGHGYDQRTIPSSFCSGSPQQHHEHAMLDLHAAHGPRRVRGVSRGAAFARGDSTLCLTKDRRQPPPLRSPSFLRARAFVARAASGAVALGGGAPSRARPAPPPRRPAVRSRARAERVLSTWRRTAARSHMRRAGRESPRGGPAPLSEAAAARIASRGHAGGAAPERRGSWVRPRQASRRRVMRSLLQAVVGSVSLGRGSPRGLVLSEEGGD